MELNCPAIVPGETTDAEQPRLLQAFLEFVDLYVLDKPSKAALRLCNKQIKTCIDATINSCTVKPYALDALWGRDWNLTVLFIGTVLLHLCCYASVLHLYTPSAV